MKKTSKSKQEPGVIKIKKWINWEVEFKKDAGDPDKIKGLNAIKKYIKGQCVTKPLSLRFTHKPAPKSQSIILSADLIHGQGIAGPKPPHPPINHPLPVELVQVKGIKAI